MPFRPEYDAIASIRSRIDSKRGPDVSVRTNRSLSAYTCMVSGSMRRTIAQGFSATFRLLLLKNWKDNATCDEST